MDDTQTPENPLSFYSDPENQAKFPRLTMLSRQVFCATATTAGVERIFNISGILLGPKRQKSSDQNFESLFFGNINSDLIDCTLPKKRKVSEISA